MGGAMIRTNYAAPQPLPSKPKKFGKEESETGRIPRPHLELKKPVLKQRNLRPPQDGTLRAVASIEARQHHSWSGFSRTGKVIQKYCGLALGFFKHDLQVEQFIYLKLQYAVNARLETLKSLRRRFMEHTEQIAWLEQNVQHANAELKKLKKNRASIEREIQRRDVRGDGAPPIGWKRWLEYEADRALDDIRRHILDMACTGRYLRKASHGNYRVVLANVQGYLSRKFMLIVDPDSRRKFIVTLKTPREYRRGLKRFQRDGNEYRNEPQRQKRRRKKGKRRSGMPVIVSKAIH
jgi:hypothetical protein